MKKAIAVVLMLAIMALTLAACNTDSGNTSSEPASTASGESKADNTSSEAEVDPYAHLRDIDLGGKEIMFYVEDEGSTRYYSQEILPNDLSPDLISQAVKTRNDFVEDLLNFKIVETRTASSGEMQSNIRAEMLGTGTYDIVMPYMTDAAILASEGAFYDLNSFDVIKLDASYWDQRANSDLSIDNKLFFSTGDFSLLTFDCTHATVFNKTVVKNNPDIEDPYKLLSEGKWTFDAMYRNAKLATSESDGEDGMTWKDNWGLMINSNYTTTMFIGSGERLTKKDTNDYPYLAVKTDKATSVIDRIVEIYNDKASTQPIETITNYTGYNDVYAAATGAFAENRVLFRTLAIVDLAELQTYENVDYGLLPTPKYTEDQEDYYNIVSCILATCFAIPTSCRNPEDSAAVCEAMAIASTDTIRKNYYEVLLKGRFIKDEEGEEALNTIFNNRVYEMGVIYTWGSLASMISTIAASGQNTFESTYEANKDTIEAAMNQTVDAFKSLG